MATFESQEFLQDYRSEVSDHLQSIGQNLLALEETLKPDTPVNAVLERSVYLEELLRSFHTIKGLSSMMGLEQAAELSHAVESLLRLIVKAEVELDSLLIDHLLQAQTLQQALVNSLAEDASSDPVLQAEMSALSKVLQSHYSLSDQPRTTSSPDPALMEAAAQPPVSLASLPIPLPAVLADSLSEIERNKLISSLLAGQRLGLAIFTPDSEKSAKGLNVNEIRKRLQNRGELIKAAPLVSGNAVRFAFLVALPAGYAPPQDDEVEWSFPTAEQPVGIQPAQPLAQAPAASQPGAYRQATRPRIAPSTSGTMVRIDLARLDELVQLVSELVVSNSHLKDLLPRLKGAPSPALDSLNQTVNRLDRTLRMLRQATMSTRMVPLSEVFNPMPLAVRDLARASGKEVHLDIEGENTQVDRLLVERLLEPLLHLVRNAITHGIETPEERQATGKPRVGRLRISGQAQGEWVRIEVEDDGRGVDLQAIADRARQMGLLGDEETITIAEALDFISTPGFTTRAEANLGAGRGMGMDVVARSVRALHGSMSLYTEPGICTRFALRLPLTLTILNAILVRCEGERFAIPQNAVDELIEIDQAQVVSMESGELYPYQQGAIALVRLADLFHLDSRSPGSDRAVPGSQNSRLLYGLVSGEGESRLALVVDRLEGLKEVVVRTIPDPLVAQPGIAGATELGDGTLVLIVDLLALLDIFRQGRK